MHCLELATLDTLQHSLAGDPEYTHCFAHRQEVVACFAVEASDEGIGQSNAPWCARCGLLTGNDPIIEQAVKCRGAMASAAAAFLTVNDSPSGTTVARSKHGIFQWLRRLATWLVWNL